MAVKRVDIQIKKMEQRAKAFDVTNPRLAIKVRGKIATLRGHKKV